MGSASSASYGIEKAYDGITNIHNNLVIGADGTQAYLWLKYNRGIKRIKIYNRWPNWHAKIRNYTLYISKTQPDSTGHPENYLVKVDLDSDKNSPNHWTHGLYQSSNYKGTFHVNIIDLSGVRMNVGDSNIRFSSLSLDSTDIKMSKFGETTNGISIDGTFRNKLTTINWT